MEPKDTTTSIELEWGQLLRPFDDNITSVTGNDIYKLSTDAATVSLGSNSSPYNSVRATGGPYTITSGAGVTGINSPWATYNSAPKIHLDGEGADIEINGWSLVDAVKKIEERLNILHPNTELETEWAELKTLGEQYRKLEQHIRDKQATWDRLKAMPPPVVE